MCRENIGVIHSDVSTTISTDDLGKNATVTGMIRSTEFAPDFCNQNILQKSAYLEISSINRNQ